MVVPWSFSFLVSILITTFIYPLYNAQNKNGKLIIALFAPLVGVFLKVISRISVQRLYNITHPGHSFVLLVPLYCGAAINFRILQADLSRIQTIVLLGIIHGAAEVIERSTMVFIDHICHQLVKRRSAPWGSFRTPRRERLMADITIMSMLFESAAIVSVNGFLYLYQYVYLTDKPLLTLLPRFAIHTSVQLVIEWFFTSVSLAIETRYQNIAVMAVWQKRWKRHTLVAIVNAVPLAIWTSTNLLAVVHGRFDEFLNQTCKMPFTWEKKTNTGEKKKRKRRQENKRKDKIPTIFFLLSLPRAHISLSPAATRTYWKIFQVGFFINLVATIRSRLKWPSSMTTSHLVFGEEKAWKSRRRGKGRRNEGGLARPSTPPENTLMKAS